LWFEILSNSSPRIFLKGGISKEGKQISPEVKNERLSPLSSIKGSRRILEKEEGGVVRECGKMARADESRVSGVAKRGGEGPMSPAWPRGEELLCQLGNRLPKQPQRTKLETSTAGNLSLTKGVAGYLQEENLRLRRGG